MSQLSLALKAPSRHRETSLSGGVIGLHFWNELAERTADTLAAWLKEHPYSGRRQ